MNIPLIEYFHKFRNAAVGRIASPYSPECGSLAYWRARVLFSVLFTGLILGTGATLSGIAVAIKENAWGLIVFDFFGYLSLSENRQGCRYKNKMLFDNWSPIKSLSMRLL